MSEGWISFSVEKKTEADEASKSKQRKRSKTTVSIGDMSLTSQKKNTFPNLQEICTSKWIGLPWALLRTTNEKCVYVPY